MVRKNEDPPQGKGIDGNKTVTLSEELEKAGRSHRETSYPDGSNVEPIDIRGDAEPEKKG